MNENQMSEVKRSPVPESMADREIEQKKPQKMNKRKWPLHVAVIIVLFSAIVFVRSEIARAGADALWKSYNDSFVQEKDAAYEIQYKKYYNRAEKKYHVANRTSITIEDMKEVANLEVLNVSDTEYIINNTADTGNGITSWLEVPGQGTFIVNLQAAEFIVDNEREYVLVRAPRPEIANISIDYKNVKKLFFKNDIFTNESYATGEDLARNQLNQADLRIKKEFASNPHYYQSARKAAASAIQCLVKQLNPSLPEMTVDVEFY